MSKTRLASRIWGATQTCLGSIRKDVSNFGLMFFESIMSDIIVKTEITFIVDKGSNEM